jgi:hypothetical protein
METKVLGFVRRLKRRDFFRDGRVDIVKVRHV